MPRKPPKPGEFMPAFDIESHAVVTMDLSKTSTGWAIHGPEGKLLYWSAQPMPGEKLWHVFDSMRMTVSRILNLTKAKVGDAPCLMVIEDAMKQPGYASRVYEVLYLAVTDVCGRAMWSDDGKKSKPIPVGVVSPMQVKAYTLGKDNKRGVEKRAITEAVRALYGIPLDPDKAHPDGDIADAIGVYVAAQALAPQGRLRNAA